MAVYPSASGRRTLDTSALSEVFDIELDEVESLQPVKRTVRKTPAEKQSVVNKSPQNSPARGARKTAVKKVPRKRSRAASGNTVGSPEAHLSDFYLSGALVELLRLKLDLTRRELAGRLGVSPQTVANWEKRTGRLNLQPRTHQALAALYADTQA